MTVVDDIDTVEPVEAADVGPPAPARLVPAGEPAGAAVEAVREG